MKKVIIILCLFVLGGCSSLKVANVEPKSGYFPSKTKATVVVNKPLDLDQRSSLILVGNSDFQKKQIKNINYFKEVITFEDLEAIIVKNCLGTKVPSIKDQIGINNAAKHYKPFLWFRLVTRSSGNDEYAQLILTDSLTLEDYFVTETHLDRIWDQSNWYPMYNSFIDYIKEHSKTYK
ncbi:hypothetical protein [uncultured Shewanella sp.]|uniref:hypothetical protein n=1 Tax=uncultured Shewanella sp. TaxID=173975 RepID=UPI00262B2AFC|nr:hypothetical protein [uncultured Shewanella sp.]